MKFKILAIILFVVSAEIKGQQAYYQQESDSVIHAASSLSVKLIPSQLIWRFPAYMLGFEHGLSKNLGIDYKFGLIRNRNNFDDDETYFNGKSGFKSSVMFRSYSLENGVLGSVFNFFNGDNFGSSPVKSFVGLELFYNQIKFDRTRIFRFDCQGGCEYFQKATYGLKMEELGARINVGFIAPLFAPVSLEVAMGFGVAHRSFNEDERKPVDFQRMYGRFYDEDFQGFLASLNLDVKLVFDLK